VIVVAGKNNIAVHALKKLINIVGKENLTVLTNKAESAVNGWQQSLKLTAQDLGIREESIESIDKSGVSIFLSLEYDQLIDPEAFSFASLYNFHFSYLPKYKGMYTSVWPIINGDLESAVTLHEIDSGIDTGDIFSQKKFYIDEKDRSQDLYNKHIQNAMLLFDEKIEEIISGNIESKPQPSYKSSYFSKSSINFSRLTINTHCTAWELKRQVYAYTFRVFQIPTIRNRPIVEVEITDTKSKQKPGTIISDNDSLITLSTIDYDVVLYQDKLNEALYWISKNEHENFKNYFKNIAGINDRNALGISPLICSAIYGNLKSIEFLVQNGANPNDRDYKGKSALMYAVDYSLKSGDNRVLEKLLKLGADPTAKDFREKSIFDYITANEARKLKL